MMALAVSAFSQNGFRGVETDTNNWFINRPTNAWAKWEADTNAVKFVRDVQNNGGVGGGTGISTNGGSGINNTFTNATLAGQPMLPGWGSLSNPTGALLGVGSDGTFRVSPNLGWSVIGLTGNIDTNSSDGIITNDPRAVTLTNPSNSFGGNGVGLKNIIFPIIYTNSGPSFTNATGTAFISNTNVPTSGTNGSNFTFSGTTNQPGFLEMFDGVNYWKTYDVTSTTNSQNGQPDGRADQLSRFNYGRLKICFSAFRVLINSAGASTNTPTAGYAAIWTGLINANGSYSLSSVAFSPSLVNLGNVVNIAQVTNTETDYLSEALGRVRLLATPAAHQPLRLAGQPRFGPRTPRLEWLRREQIQTQLDFINQPPPLERMLETITQAHRPTSPSPETCLRPMASGLQPLTAPEPRTGFTQRRTPRHQL